MKKQRSAKSMHRKKNASSAKNPVTIAVGSLNPAKRKGVKEGFLATKQFSKLNIVGVAVDSKVSPMPSSEEEAIQGAIERAKQALQKTNADFGVGLEGAIADTPYGMFVMGWVAIINKNGMLGLGCGGKMLLPEQIRKKILEGYELATVMDEITGKQNIRSNEGAYGVLTHGIITRSANYKLAVIFALSPFFHPYYYQKRKRTKQPQS